MKDVSLELLRLDLQVYLTKKSWDHEVACADVSTHGAVLVTICASFWRWVIFNAASVGLCCGVVGMCLKGWCRSCCS